MCLVPGGRQTEPMWPTDEARAHLDHLAERHGIEVVWSDNVPESHPTYQMVWISEPTSGHRYLTALHEFGHCLDPEAVRLHTVCSRKDQRKNHALWMRCESAAWVWAFGAARPELVEEILARDWHVALGAWLSYGQHLASRPAV